MGPMDKSESMMNSYSGSKWPLDGEAFSPPSGIYHSQQHYESHLLWLKIITLTNQVDITDGLNARDGESNFNSGHEAKTSPIHQSTKKIWHKTQYTLVFGRDRNWMPCVFCQNEATSMKSKCLSACNMRLWATVCCEVYHTRLHLWLPFYTKLDRQSAQA